jgi:hypothetical protein
VPDGNDVFFKIMPFGKNGIPRAPAHAGRTKDGMTEGETQRNPNADIA